MKPIYLDYAATTPVDPRVLDAMLPYFNERFGNAASRQHVFGKTAEEAVEHARIQVAQAIGADAREIIWTSGATESDNLALKGVAHSPYYASRGNHIVTVATEHKAVLDTCARLEAGGLSVVYLPVDATGHLDLDRLADAITTRTILVSIMHANNEIGVLHPIREIGRLCKERGVLFHTDATQSFGKEPIDVEADHIDLLSLSAHKIYGPKGVGALYVRRKGPRVRCAPLIDGGGHERGLRSGTLNVPGVVGLGKAAELASSELRPNPIPLPEGEKSDPAANASRDSNIARIRDLRDLLESTLVTRLDDVFRNGAPEHRLAGITNLSFAGVNADKVMALMPDVAVSSSAACTSAARQPSYVLAALGHDAARIEGSIRFSLGRFTTRAEIGAAIEEVVRAVTLARKDTTHPERAKDPYSGRDCSTL